MSERVTSSTWRRGAVRFARLATILAAFLLLAGCASKVPATNYYTLRPPLPSAAASVPQPLPVDIGVMRFAVATQALAQDRLVYRDGPHKVGFYEYQRWADNPADLVTNAVVDYLRKTGAFRTVGVFRSTPENTLLLRGQVESLEEVDSEGGVSARAGLSADLYDPKTRTVVWRGRGTEERAVGQRSVDGVVRGLNEALDATIEQLARSMIAELQQRPQGK